MSLLLLFSVFLLKGKAERLMSTTNRKHAKCYAICTILTMYDYMVPSFYLFVSSNDFSMLTMTISKQICRPFIFCSSDTFEHHCHKVPLNAFCNYYEMKCTNHFHQLSNELKIHIIDISS